MNKKQKIVMCIIAILTVVSLFINFTLVMAFYSTPNQIKVNTKTVKSRSIPSSLNNVTIVYFSDLQYGEFQNDERCKKLFNQIQELNPDVLLFGGDLYDSDYEYTDETNNKLVEYLSSIEAPLGKFAILGEKDNASDDYKNTVSSILSKSEFEILNNSSIKLSNHKNEYINLIGFGIDSDVETINKLSSKKRYDLVLTHYPDNLVADGLVSTNIDLAIAGHAHDSQISFPIKGNYRVTKGSKKFNRNNQQSVDFEYILSPGVGCTKVNARLNSTPEIEYLILKSNS